MFVKFKRQLRITLKRELPFGKWWSNVGGQQFDIMGYHQEYGYQVAGVGEDIQFYIPEETIDHITFMPSEQTTMKLVEPLEIIKEPLLITEETETDAKIINLNPKV